MEDWIPLCLVLALLVAGCSAPTAPDDGERYLPAAAVEDPVAPDVPVSKNATFERVERVLGVDGVRPPVEVTNISWRSDSAPTKFQILMGVTETRSGGGPSGRFLLRRGRVLVNAEIRSAESIEGTLVHEYVHAVQFERGLRPQSSGFGFTSTTDATLTRNALLEGGAVWVADRYFERYLPNRPPQSNRMVREYEGAPALSRYLLARYRFGHRYIDGRIDSTGNLSRVYENPPETTEQLLHGYTIPEEPPANLTIKVVTRPTVPKLGLDTQGELATRMVLRSELPADRARVAAEGWAADRLREFEFERSNAAFGVAWALRWDGPADAREFRSAFRDYAERRRANSTVDYRLVPVSDETVVVFAGPSAFVDGARANGTSSDVHVSIEPAAN